MASMCLVLPTECRFLKDQKVVGGRRIDEESDGGEEESG